MSSKNGLEFNKMAGALFLAGLIAMVSGKTADFLYGGDSHAGHGKEEKRGYSIEVIADATASGAAAPKGAADISALYATADIEAGKTYFAKKCATCHTVDKGGADGVGPHLWGAMGRPVASAAGFKYSEGLKKHADAKWDFNTLNQWLYNPRKFAAGTIMAFAGIPKDQERANLIAYLNTQTDTKLTPPAAPAPAAEVK